MDVTSEVRAVHLYTVFSCSRISYHIMSIRMNTVPAIASYCINKDFVVFNNPVEQFIIFSLPPPCYMFFTLLTCQLPNFLI